MIKKLCQAFSLLELMICLSIIMILCMFLPSRFFNSDRQMLMQELDTLFVTFSYLQQRAMASSKHQVLTCDNTQQSYSYLNKGKLFTKRLSSGVKFGFLPGAFGPPSDPKIQIENSLTFPLHQQHPQVTFFPDGKVTPGTLYLVDKQQKNMVALTCPISQVSYIRKYRYENKRWISLERVRE